MYLSRVIAGKYSALVIIKAIPPPWYTSFNWIKYSKYEYVHCQCIPTSALNWCQCISNRMSMHVTKKYFFRLEHRPDLSFSQNQSPRTWIYLLLTACWCQSNQPRHIMWDIRPVALATACVVSLDDICQCIIDSYPWLYTIKLLYFCLKMLKRDNFG